MSVIEITNRDALRAGDTATFTYRGHEFTGVVWDEKGQLFIGRTRVYDPHGGWSHGLDFVHAARVVPDLPTEPGTVIYIARLTDAEPFDEPRAAVLIGDASWVTLTPDGNSHTWLIPEQIAEWAPAKVVPA